MSWAVYDAKRFSSTTVHLPGVILKAPPKSKKKSDVYKLNLQASPYTNRILTVNKILIRYVRESHLPKQVLKMGLRKKNMHFCLEHSFSGDPVFPHSKVSAKL